MAVNFVGSGPGITASIHADVSRIAEQIGRMRGDLKAAALEAMDLTLSEMVADLHLKMTAEPPVSSRGPIPRNGAYLGVRTGRGRGSIRSMVEETSDRIRGSFGPTGDPAVYIVPHEQGFTGTVQVSSHTRAVRGRRVPVRAHSRFMDMPARRFIRAALLEGRPKLQRNLLAILEQLFGVGAGVSTQRVA